MSYLEKEMEALRKYMQELTKGKKLTDSEVIAISPQLDHLLNLHNKETKRNQA